ncbi:Coenzyme F420 hydrogenase/dehydrogenase, beta subunit C-terminal domain [Bacteroides sp. KG123]|uniref:Coenzyme F420 hydrogenase/dehydrogenase, beta subunit C-terminal domain n=1 Tax=unclassified Bacteroides TaxID=2646097 RepID=UPI003D7FBDD2
MRQDEEGFLYPFVNEYICINCGLCNKVCPVLNQFESSENTNVYAAKNRNDNQRLDSSSGGIFVLLAKNILANSGYVFGAKFTSSWGVEHCGIVSPDEIYLLMRSKYVQSQIGNSFKEVKNLLIDGKKVLFVGTPCQISGLKHFLGKDYANLYSIDFICHGVPSPMVWHNYLTSIKQESYCNNISYVNFREKQKGGFDWETFGLQIKGEKEEGREEVIQSMSFKEDPYMKAFLNNYILRPSCYKCPAKGGKSNSDLTLADFWGINQINLNPDNKGTSLIIVHSEKGKCLYEKIEKNIESKSHSIEQALKHNRAYYMSYKETRRRKRFWKYYSTHQDLIKSINFAEDINVIYQMFELIRSTLNRIIINALEKLHLKNVILKKIYGYKQS